MVEYVLQLKDEKKKVDPRKIPKRLYIKLKTNIERFKRVNFNQKMISSNSPGENYLYFMKYYPLYKKYFDDYTKQNRFQLFFSKSNIIRTTVRKTPTDNPEYVYKNIQFIVDNIFENNQKIYLNTEPFTIFSSSWDKKVYKTNNPNVYQIDVKLILAKGDKLSSADSFQLTCNQRVSEISEDVDIIFDNLSQYIKSFSNNEEKEKTNEERKEWIPEDDKTPKLLPIAKVVKSINID